MIELRSPENRDLRLAVDATCEAARLYAEETLQLSTVDVHVGACHYPFTQSLPDYLQSAFAHLHRPAKNVSTLDMQISYDRGDMLFRPNNVSLRLDNDYTISFSRVAIGVERGKDASLFYPMLVTPAGKSAVTPDQTKLAPESFVYSLLDELGVSVPIEPQRASWEAIQDILQFSSRWTAKVDHTAQLEPLRALRVDSRVDGVGMVDPTDFDENELAKIDSDKETNISEIILAVEDSPSKGHRPTTALQLIQRAEGETKPYIFGGLAKLDIAYAYNHPQMHYRAQGDPGKRVLPTVHLLDSIRSYIERAQTLEAW